MNYPDKHIIIGVDVGGTKIRAGAVNPDGGIIGNPVIVDTVGSDESEKIFGRISDSIAEVIRNSGFKTSEISGIGMGVTGPLDTVAGTILECPQLPTMNFYPLREKIREKFKLPVIMDNDANALLLGESTFGAGKGYRTVLGYTLGTGLGCAIIIDNKLFSGANGMAGEIWPSPHENATIEDIVSGRGVSSIYRNLTSHVKTSKEISSLASDGDKNAIETWNIFGRSLAFSLAWGINMIDPDIVVIGGSIAESMNLFYESMDTSLRKYICPVPASKTRVVKAALADNAGFLGAACLLMQGK